MAFREVKVCLLGDSGVGKSSIVQRFVNDTFNANSESTIGASFMTKNVTIDGITYKFNIWDTAGQERYRALAPMYYRGAGAAVLVFDVTSQESFHAVKSWVKELNLHGPSQIVLAVAGNKCDLQDLREITYSKAKEYADTINSAFIETSALTASNINELFIEMSKKLPKPLGLLHEQPKLSVKLGKGRNKSKKCC